MDIANAVLLTWPTALLFAAGYLLRWRDIPRYWIWFGYINWRAPHSVHGLPMFAVEQQAMPECSAYGVLCKVLGWQWKCHVPGVSAASCSGTESYIPVTWCAVLRQRAALTGDAPRQAVVRMGRTDDQPVEEVFSTLSYPTLC